MAFGSHGSASALAGAGLLLLLACGDGGYVGPGPGAGANSSAHKGDGGSSGTSGTSGNGNGGSSGSGSGGWSGSGGSGSGGWSGSGGNAGWSGSGGSGNAGWSGSGGSGHGGWSGSGGSGGSGWSGSGGGGAAGSGGSAGSWGGNGGIGGSAPGQDPVFVVIPHPGDEASVLTFIERETGDRLVPVLLTQGEQAPVCNNQSLVGDFNHDGQFNVQDCKAKQVASFHSFWGTRGVVEPRRFVFDLGHGALTPETVLEAIEHARSRVGAPSRMVTALFSRADAHPDHAAATVAVGRWGRLYNRYVEAIGAATSEDKDGTQTLQSLTALLDCPTGTFQAPYGWLSGSECWDSNQLAPGGEQHWRALRDTERLAGPSRVDTLVEISKYAYPHKASVVYLANTVNQVNVMTAGILSDGPLLITPNDHLPESVTKEIARLDPDQVIALGNASDLSNMLLSETSKPFVRLCGSDRIETSILISQRAFSGHAAHVYLADGWDTSRSLNYGALTDGPVLLVDPSNYPVVTDPYGDSYATLPQPVLDEISRLAPGKLIVLAEAAVIPDDVLQEVLVPWERKTASSVHQSILQLAQWAVEHGAPANEVLLFDADDWAVPVAAGFTRTLPLAAHAQASGPDALLLHPEVAAYIRALQPARVIAGGTVAEVTQQQLAEGAGL